MAAEQLSEREDDDRQIEDGLGLACSLLLVEDHADTRRSMQMLLQNSGCAVKTAASAAEALELARQHKFDVVVSDIGLPDTTGTELMAKLKALYDIRGIALSGYGMEDDLARSSKAGFSMHLIKPVSIGVLEDAIRQLTTK